VADYFTPYNQLSLQNSDADLGSGGPLLLPDSVGSATHPHLIVGAGKKGRFTCWIATTWDITTAPMESME